MKLPDKTFEVEQPKEWLETEGGMCVRMIELEKAGYMVPQHTHDFGHTTLIASGSVRMWVEEEYKGQFDAPCLKYVEPNKKHVYQAVKDNTVMACISRQE